MQSGHSKRPELSVEKAQKSPRERKLLRHMKAVNEIMLELKYQSHCLHTRGDIQGAVKKKRAAEEARRYLNALVARHKKLYGRRT